MSLPDLTRKNSNSEIVLSSEEVDHYEELVDFLPPELYEAIKAWKSGQESFVFHTSGSTGDPKDIRISRERILTSAQKTIRYFNLRPGITALIALNLEYIAGFMMLIRALEARMEIHYFPPTSDPFEKLNTHKTYFAALVPLQVHALLEKPFDIENFHALIIGGAALNLDLRLKLSHLHYPIYETYGMTETVSHIAFRRLNGSHASDLFHTLDNVEINTDKSYCLKIKADVTSNKWIQTRDVVQILDAKSFHLLGRKDDIINSGGIKIHPLEVEDKLNQLSRDRLLHREFIISSISDERLGSKAVLVVEGIPFDTSIEYALSSDFQQIEKFKRPKDILYLPKFPRTNSGKIQRLEVKKLIRKLSLNGGNIPSHS